MWIYPTYNRPEQCLESLTQINKVGVNTPGIVIVQGEDKHTEYPNVLEQVLPTEWATLYLPTPIGLCGAMNKAFELHPSEPFYGLTTDSEFVLTPNWDTNLAAAAGDWYIAHGNNGWQSDKRIHGYATMGGELARALGYLQPPGLWHWYSDNVWEYLATTCDLRRWCKEIRIRTRHHLLGNAPYDHTYKTSQAYRDQDAKVYQDWQLHSAPLIERLKEKLPRKCYSFV